MTKKQINVTRGLMTAIGLILMKCSINDFANEANNVLYFAGALLCVPMLSCAFFKFKKDLKNVEEKFEEIKSRRSAKSSTRNKNN